MTVVMVLTVLILLSSCTMEDAEYVGGLLSSMTDLETKVPLSTTKIATQPPVYTTPVTTQEYPGCHWHPTPEVPKDGIIETAEQLHAVLIKGDASKDYTVVAKELDMSRFSWRGMENYSGTFDFGGCVIKNAVDSLFISVKGGTIKNLVIADTEYLYSNDEAQSEIDPVVGTAPNLHYSPVVRYAENITISNVTIQSSVKIKSDIWADNSCHGAIIGRAVGDNVLIENCHFAGEYETDSLVVNFGGIAGYIRSSSEETVDLKDPIASKVRIVGCTNTGRVVNICVGGDSKVSGIVGRIDNGAVIGCGNYGEVNSRGAGQTAGVVGYVYGNSYVKNCINTASVKGNQYVGGVCGYSNGENRYFENCINLGNMSSDSKYGYFGGIIGYVKLQENLINCFNLKDQCENFAYYHKLGVIDPGDPTTFGDAKLTNCANLSYVEDILSAIKDVAPSVFKMAQNGLLELL